MEKVKAGAVEENGLKVPDDVSVIGFDDIRMPTMDTIRLTTMRIPLEEMAELSLEILKSTGDMNTFKQYVLQPELVVGQSVKL